MTAPHRLLYPLNEAAALLGVGRTTLYELIRRRELPTTKIGRKSLIHTDDLDRYAEQLKERSR